MRAAMRLCSKNIIFALPVESYWTKSKCVPLLHGTTARRTMPTCKSSKSFCRTAMNAIRVGNAFATAKYWSSLKRLQRSAKYPQGRRMMRAAMPHKDSICPTFSLEPDMSMMYVSRKSRDAIAYCTARAKKRYMQTATLIFLARFSPDGPTRGGVSWSTWSMIDCKSTALLLEANAKVSNVVRRHLVAVAATGSIFWSFLNLLYCWFCWY